MGKRKRLNDEGAKFHKFPNQNPILPGNVFYAFLGRVDFYDIGGVKKVDLVFDVEQSINLFKIVKSGSCPSVEPMPKRRRLNTFQANINYGSNPRIFHICEQDASSFKEINLNEGSWYWIQLDIVASSISSPISWGYFYVPDYNGDEHSVPRRFLNKIDLVDPEDINRLDECQKICLPSFRSGGTRRRTIGDTNSSPLGGVGIMHVGQGNCNILFNQDSSVEYCYDIGYPLWFYKSSSTQDYGSMKKILNHNKVTVILSHWDWDHWRLAKMENIDEIKWIVPEQRMGPSTKSFLFSIRHKAYYCSTPVTSLKNGAIEILKCQGGDINNSGLAVKVYSLKSDAGQRYTVLTGDASFSNIALGTDSGKTFAITAVHHGSNRHDATNNIPGSVKYFAFSYGVTSTGKHPYGHPTNEAMNLTNLSDKPAWITAERNFYSSPPDVIKGNIFFGLNDTRVRINETYPGLFIVKYRSFQLEQAK